MYRPRTYFVPLLLIALYLSVGSPAFAAKSSSDADAHEAAADAARAKAAEEQALARELQSQTKVLDERVQTLQDQADALDPEVATALKRVQHLRIEVRRMRSRIASTSADIDETQTELASEQALLHARVVETYKEGEQYYLGLLLDSSSFGDLVARADLVGRVLQANSDVAARLSAERESLEEQKAALDRSLVELTAKEQEAAAVQTNLNRLQDTRQAKADAQQSVLSEKSQLLTQSEKNAKRLLAVAKSEEAESARIRSELANKREGSGKVNGSMSWPVPGFRRITSPFGMRMHPILHVKRMHNGIDIGRSGGKSIAGASIVSVASGKVISAGYRSGYGYTVMIDHGNGVVTLYAHQPPGGIKVSKGQRVSRGQRIGTVGMSGYATGPHLHFEVRVNGTPKNPMGYL